MRRVTLALAVGSVLLTVSILGLALSDIDDPFSTDDDGSEGADYPAEDGGGQDSGDEYSNSDGVFSPEETKKEPQKLDDGGDAEPCSDDPVQFTVSPLPIEDLEYIVPRGLMTGDHVTPIDHQYWTPVGGMAFEEATKYDTRFTVVAPGDGTITEVTKHDGGVGFTYHLRIDHSCTISTRYMVLYDLPDWLHEEVQYRPDGRFYGSIPVKAGEPIAIIGPHPFDFAVHDESVTLPFVDPSHYPEEKTQSVNPYPYFTPDLKSVLESYSIRNGDPAGKLAYDVDGTLLGNWFREGTGGYTCNYEIERCWSNHLSVVYDHIDESQIRISLGDYNGSSEQFGVIGNEPDPVTVTPESGLVTYELAAFGHQTRDGTWWNHDGWEPGMELSGVTYPHRQATVLFQMVDSRTVLVEVFPQTSADEVDGFTDNAERYVR